MSIKRKILFLAANPKDTHRLKLDREVREIEKELRRSNIRQTFEIKQQWAVRIEDLRHALLDYEPQIVHFSGHGQASELMLEDDAGNTQRVVSQALVGLLELFKTQIECVVLNACFSEPLAKALNEHIDYVIGMKDSISDTSASEFSVGFYAALCAGRSYLDAFKLGCNAIQFYDGQQHITPIFLGKPNSLENSQSEERNDSCLELFPKTLSEESQTAYQLLIKKLNLLKTQYVVESDPTRKFQLNYQIEEAQKDLKRLETW